MHYNAFISYRHSELDMYVAKKVHKKLETFKVPRAVRKKTGKKTIERVFRDQEELPIGSNLGENIVHALEESDFLIVICSPRTPESYWVQTEIETFIRLHGRERVLAVLIEGEPEESFPKQILFDDQGKPVEPLAADVRGTSRREVDRKMKTEIVRLAAPLLGCSYDELRQRHRERRLKKALTASAVVAALALAFGGYSVHNALEIQKNYREKQVNQSRYLSSTAMSLLENGDRRTAGLVALSALPSEENDRPYVADAQYALTQALGVYENGNELKKDGLLKHELPVSKISYSVDGSMLLTIDQGENVSVWDVEKNMLVGTVAPRLDESGTPVNVYAVTYPDNQNLVILSESGIRCETMAGEILWESECDGYIQNGAVDRNQQTGVLIGNYEVDLYRLSDGEKIGTLKTSSPEMFASCHAFLPEKNLFAVAGTEVEKKENGKVYLSSLEDFQMRKIKTARSYIIDLAFCEDGDLMVLSCGDEALMSLSLEEEEAFLEKFDSETGERIWKQKFSMHIWDMDTKIIMKTRSYVDEANVKHEDVVIANAEMITTWNAMDGTLCSEIGMSSTITDMVLSGEGPLAFVTEKNGTLNFCNLEKGEIYPDVVVDVGADVAEFVVKNSVLAARFKYSPDVLLMKYTKGNGMEELAEYPDSLDEMRFSPKEQYYAVVCEDNTIYFYKTEDDTSAGEWKLQDDVRAAECYFADESTFVLIDRSGRFYFYDLSMAKEELVEPGVDMLLVDYEYSADKRMVFIYDSDGYALMDISQQKFVQEKELENDLTGGVLSPDGSKFYGSLSDLSLVCIDTDTGKCTDFSEKNCQAASSQSGRQVFAISPDGKYVAVSCTDMKLRVFDTETGNVVEELNFTGQMRCFLGFLGDSPRLLMQGDTYTFCVYDLSEHKYVYISEEQYPMFRQIAVGEGGEIGLLSYGNLLILNQSDARPLANVENGLAFLPNQGVIFSQDGNTLYRFTYMNLDKLREEAKRQFGDASLTEQERMQYNID